jgi:chlorite dismutase
MALTPIEKLQKEAAKANATLQSEKKKNREFKAKNRELKIKNQTLKEEIRHLHKQADGMEGKISRRREQNERLKQSLQAELKKTARCNCTSAAYCKTSIYGLNRPAVRGNLYENPYRL